VPNAPRLRGTFGVSGLAQRNDSRGIIPLVPDATIASAGAFAFEQLSLGSSGRLALLGGARADARHLAADADSRLAVADQSRNSGAVTGDLGAVYRAAPTVALAVNVGTAWRAPTLFELFANGPRLGEGRYELGRASLDPERSVNVDASVRWESPRGRAELAAFRTRVSEFVFITPTGVVRDGLRVFQYDQADATLAGGEASATVSATDALALRGRVDVVRGTNTTTDDPLPLMPPVRAALGAELRARAGRYGRPFVDAEVEHVARSSRLSAAERSAVPVAGRFPLATAAYTLLDVGGGLTLPLGGRSTGVDLRVRNATNQRYRDFLSRYKEFAYAPGTNVVLRLTTSF
jgi:outer membrane receptor protein involved in Fe transport